MVAGARLLDLLDQLRGGQVVVLILTISSGLTGRPPVRCCLRCDACGRTRCW